MTRDECDRITTRLDATCGELSRLHSDLATYVASHEDCARRCAKHEQTLYGNGRTGLVTKVGILTWVQTVGVSLVTAVVVVLLEKFL